MRNVRSLLWAQAQAVARLDEVMIAPNAEWKRYDP